MNTSVSRRLLWVGLLAWLSFAVALLAYLIRFVALPERTFLYNSDMLYVPALYESIVAGEDLSLWRLSTAPYFFPDMALFFALRAVSGNLHRAIVLLSITQSTVFVTGIAALGYRIQRSWRAPTLAALLGALFFSVLQWLPFAFILIFFNSFHFGTLLMLPSSLLLAFALLDPPSYQAHRRSWLVWGMLALLVTLCTASDILYIVQMSVPLAIAAGLGLRCGLSLRRAGGLWAALTVGSFTGYMLAKLLIRFPYPAVVQDGIEPRLNALRELSRLATTFAISLPLLGLAWLVFVGLTLWIVVRSLYGGAAVAKRIGLLRTLTAYTLLGSVGCNLTALVLMANVAERYMLPTLFLPTFFGWPLLLRLDTSTSTLFSGVREKGSVSGQGELSRPAQKRFLQGRAESIIFHPISFVFAAAVLILVCIPTLPQSGALAAYTDYYPPWIRCIDEEAHRLGLRAGLAHYWQARPITRLSKYGLVVAPVERPLTPFYVVNSLVDFQHYSDFVLIDTSEAGRPFLLDEAFIQEQFGPPATTFTCGETRGLVYNRPNDRVFSTYLSKHAVLAQFNLNNEVTRLDAASLTGEIGRLDGLSRRAEPGMSGHLINGPGLHLDPGRYMFRLDYRAEGSGGMRPGYWDVLALDSAGHGKVLVTADLPAVGRSVCAVFAFREPRNVAIRALYENRGTLIIDNLTITRLP